MTIARKIEQRRRAAEKTVKKLMAATAALNDYISLCNAIKDGREVKRGDDSRVVLAQDMIDQAIWMERYIGTPQ